MSLHVVEEIWNMLQSDDSTTLDPDGSESEEESLMTLSKVAILGIHSPTTLKLWGMIKDKEFPMLVDFGNSNSFINTHSIALFKHQRTNMPLSLSLVHVENGQILECSSMLAPCPWWVQGHTFYTDSQVLPLSCCDVILGMDWINAHISIRHQCDMKKMVF